MYDIIRYGILLVVIAIVVLVLRWSVRKSPQLSQRAELIQK